MLVKGWPGPRPGASGRGEWGQPPPSVPALAGALPALPTVLKVLSFGASGRTFDRLFFVSVEGGSLASPGTDPGTVSVGGPVGPVCVWCVCSVSASMQKVQRYLCGSRWWRHSGLCPRLCRARNAGLEGKARARGC